MNLREDAAFVEAVATGRKKLIFPALMALEADYEVYVVTDTSGGTALAREHAGAYGMGVGYAYTMAHSAPQRAA